MLIVPTSGGTVCWISRKKILGLPCGIFGPSIEILFVYIENYKIYLTLLLSVHFASSLTDPPKPFICQYLKGGITVYNIITMYSVDAFPHEFTAHRWQALFTFQNLSKGFEGSNCAWVFITSIKINLNEF